MPKEVTVREWVEELASGQWMPMRGQLGSVEYDPETVSYQTSGNERCCLGVLCEMTGVEFHGNDTFPPVEILSYAPWLVDHYVEETFVVESREGVLAQLEDRRLDMETVLSDFASANDGEFLRYYDQLLQQNVDRKPKDFGPVIEIIRAWYGLEERGQ